MSNQVPESALIPIAFDETTAARLLGSSPSTLEKDRATGHLGIPFVRAGRRVLYRLADLERWLEQNCTTPPANDEHGGGHV
jgi:excisionase family DNA binding protein